MEQEVFPADAGVIPIGFFHAKTSRSLSRRRGGDPSIIFFHAHLSKSFPQTRG